MTLDSLVIMMPIDLPHMILLSCLEYGLQKE